MKKPSEYCGNMKGAKMAHYTTPEVLRAGHNTVPNSKAPLGQGGRFAALEKKLSKNPKIKNPGAVAASIGRKKYGPKKFAALGFAGKKAAK